jgi:L-lactate dehydrogenase complex protein LldG
MSAAREAILAKLRAAPKGAVVEPDVAGYYAKSTPQRSQVERLAQFQRLMTSAHAEVHWVREGRWQDKLAELVKAHGHQSLLLAPNTAHGARAAEALTQLQGGPMLNGFDRPAEEWKDELFNGIDASFTGTRAGIAETGSLIVWPDAHEPRTMSLVPPVHYALLEGAKLYQNFHQAMASEGWQYGLPTNSLLISGPSKTSDIQQTVAYGAHGPRELVVLVIVPDEIDLSELEVAA